MQNIIEQIEYMKKLNDPYEGRKGAISSIFEIAKSAAGDVDSSAVDFPNVLNASWYVMILEGLGRAFNSQSSQWDEKLMYIPTKQDDQVFWLKNTKNYINEKLRELKEEKESEMKKAAAQ